MDCGVEKDIQKAVAEFEVLLREQVARNERIRKSRESAGNGKEEGRGVTIGLTAGDGIGPVIMKEARAVLEKLLAEELASGEVRLREIDGFTLENRLEKGQTVPDEVLTEMRQCDVLLKGPTTTPNASMNTKNLESANVYLRKTFDLYANVRPVSIPEEGIDWTFFRENTEGIRVGKPRHSNRRLLGCGFQGDHPGRNPANRSGCLRFRPGQRKEASVHRDEGQYHEEDRR